MMILNFVAQVTIKNKVSIKNEDVMETSDSFFIISFPNHLDSKKAYLDSKEACFKVPSQFQLQLTRVENQRSGLLELLDLKVQKPLGILQKSI